MSKTNGEGPMAPTEQMMTFERMKESRDYFSGKHDQCIERCAELESKVSLLTMEKDRLLDKLKWAKVYWEQDKKHLSKALIDEALNDTTQPRITEGNG